MLFSAAPNQSRSKKKKKKKSMAGNFPMYAVITFFLWTEFFFYPSPSGHICHVNLLHCNWLDIFFLESPFYKKKKKKELENFCFHLFPVLWYMDPRIMTLGIVLHFPFLIAWNKSSLSLSISRFVYFILTYSPTDLSFMIRTYSACQ